jgi:hypothetical protein
MDKATTGDVFAITLHPSRRRDSIIARRAPSVIARSLRRGNPCLCATTPWIACRGPLLARLTSIKSTHLAPPNWTLENKSKAQFESGLCLAWISSQWLVKPDFSSACGSWHAMD